MSNFLDLRCPECGNENRIHILAELWVRAGEDGTEPSHEGYQFTPKSLACCRACNHSARLSHFETDEASS